MPATGSPLGRGSGALAKQQPIDEQRHCALVFVTPSQHHAEQGKDLLAGRAAVYRLARQTHPQSWSKQCRNWRWVDQAHLNPDTPKPTEAETLKKAAGFTTLMR